MNIESIGAMDKLEGQLHKFTNVVMGHQHRWFILNPENGTLAYYLVEDAKKNRPRGFIHLAGANICPSEEDSNTFTVNSASGETYKLKAFDAKERQMWVDRLRSVAEFHTQNIANYNPTPAPVFQATIARSQKDDEQSFQRAQQRVAGDSRTVYEAFISARDVIQMAERNSAALSVAIEKLPKSGSSITAIDKDLLILKSVANSTVSSIEDCLSMLHEQQMAASYKQIGSTGGTQGEWVESRSRHSSRKSAKHGKTGSGSFTITTPGTPPSLPGDRLHSPGPFHRTLSVSSHAPLSSAPLTPQSPNMK